MILWKSPPPIFNASGYHMRPVLIGSGNPNYLLTDAHSHAGTTLILPTSVSMVFSWLRGDDQGFAQPGFLHGGAQGP